MPLVVLALSAQQPAPKTQEQEPPEEDRPQERVIEYTFNPLQAEKELNVGKYYFKRQSYKAAARRFEEATKWNPGLAEAWLRLGETETRLKDDKAARSAYEKFLELAPDHKEAAALRRKLGEPAARRSK